MNIGRDAGLRPGDEVTFFPANDGIVNGTVQSVSASSGRCTILSTQNSVDIGTRAEVLLPTDRLSLEQERSEPRSDIPEHPAWTATPQNWDENQPLLAAPAYARTAAERDLELHGRLFASYMHTLNQYDQQNQYSLGRIGASMWMENPFRRGGGLYVDAELNRRGVFLDDDDDDIYGPGRLDRLSYYWGGSETQPLRFEMGRFLSSEFPEFGVLDGTELVYRTAAGHRIGASVGLLPEPFPNLSVIGDLHIAAFYRWVYDPEETLSSAIGLQKTWHRGTPDRDLLIWSTDYDPNLYVSVHGTVWVDFYDSRDTLKTTNAEVTQAIFQPIFRINPRHGFGANISSIRWPQLLRLDYSPYVDQQIIRDDVFRWGLFTWHDLGARTRIDGRVDQWRDQSQQTGTSWEGRVAFRDWLYDHGEVAFAVFTTQGLYSSGPGGRVSLNRSFPWCFASLWYDFANNRLNQPSNGMGLNNNLSVLSQHSVRANLDFSLSSEQVGLDLRGLSIWQFSGCDICGNLPAKEAVKDRTRWNVSESLDADCGWRLQPATCRRHA